MFLVDQPEDKQTYLSHVYTYSKPRTQCTKNILTYSTNPRSPLTYFMMGGGGGGGCLRDFYGSLKDAEAFWLKSTICSIMNAI